MSKFADCRLVAAAIAATMSVMCITLFIKQSVEKLYAEKIPPRPVFSYAKSFDSGAQRAFVSSAHAWVLQAADFSLPERIAAEALVRLLREKGFKTYQRSVILSTGSVIRIFVGPEFKLTNIKSLANRLIQETSLKPTIMAFDPLLL